MVKGLPAVLIEAFSAEPLGGNGAAVVQLATAAPASWMQSVAGRLQQSETAFLLPWQGAWALRWFTPCQEVPLCGHATLAAILALGFWQRLPGDGCTTFLTRSGPLRVRCLHGVSSQPAAQPALAQIELPTYALEPLEAPPDVVALLQRRHPQGLEQFWQSSLGYQVGLLSPSAPLAQWHGCAAELEGPARRGLVLMQALPPGPEGRAAVAGMGADYQLRFFAPELGIEEDAVTGSAHALVAPFWMKLLEKPRVVGWQCSDRPGGMVCEAVSSGMIRLSGSGHLLWEGTFWAEPEDGWPPGEALADWQLACGP